MPQSPLKLDLRDLTQAHIDEAMPNMGGACTYASPCIIGTLIPEDRRGEMDVHTCSVGSPHIGELVRTNRIQFPNPEQAELAEKLQEVYDEGFNEEFNALCETILALPR